MSSRFEGPGFGSYDEQSQSEWGSEELEHSPGPQQPSGSDRRRLGRSVTPRLVLGLALLALLAVAVWWGVQTILLPQVATPTPTPLVTLAILPPPTSGPTPAATITLATRVPLPTPTAVGGEIHEGGRVRVVGTGAEGIRFRSGPGLDFLTRAIILDGAELQVLAGPEDGDGFTWWRLEMEDGTIGWTAEDWLQPISEVE